MIKEGEQALMQEKVRSILKVFLAKGQGNIVTSYVCYCGEIYVKDYKYMATNSKKLRVFRSYKKTTITTESTAPNFYVGDASKNVCPRITTYGKSTQI